MRSNKKFSNMNGKIGYGALVVLVLVSVSAAMLMVRYAGSGESESAQVEVGKPEIPAAHELTPQAAAQPSVQEMLGRLEARLASQPDDAKGWKLLGRSYQYLGRDADAQQAFARARELENQDSAAVVNLGRIRGKVALDPELLGRLAGNETVFVFARAVSGPRMPLAVMRTTVDQLPVEFELNDSTAMSPDMKLSSVAEAIVGARISITGNATATAGDLEGYSNTVTAGNAETVEITIDQVVLGKHGIDGAQ